MVRVTLKATTTCKRTRAVKKKKVVFRATAEGTSIGSLQAESDIHIDDPNLSSVHGHIIRTEAGVALRTEGRTYFLIGQGPTTDVTVHKLEKTQIIKMGACSLQITDVCTARTDERVFLPPVAT